MNLKKVFIGFGIVVVVLVAVAAGMVLLSGTKTTTTQSALSDGVLTIAIVPSDDQYCYVDGDAYAGVEPTVALSTAAAGNAEAVLKAYQTKAEAMAALSSGEVELVLSRMDSTDETIAGFTTSASYGSGSLYLITPKNTYISALSLLSDQVVVVSQDVTMDMKVEIPNYSAVTTMSATSQDDYVSLLEEGVAAAVLCSEWEAVSVALSGAAVQVQSLTNSPSESYVAVMQSGDSQLLAATNGAVNGYLDGTKEG